MRRIRPCPDARAGGGQFVAGAVRTVCERCASDAFVPPGSLARRAAGRSIQQLKPAIEKCAAGIGGMQLACVNSTFEIVWTVMNFWVTFQVAGNRRAAIGSSGGSKVPLTSWGINA